MSEAETLALIAGINERLHRMTVCDTQAVRVQLCAEVKRDMATVIADQVKRAARSS